MNDNGTASEVGGLGSFAVSFLASGVNSDNWLLTALTGQQRFVLRVPRRTEAMEALLRRELAVLQLLAPSGVTPVPRCIVEDPRFGMGLVSEFIDGERLSYQHDLASLATALARVHRLPALVPWSSKVASTHLLRDGLSALMRTRDVASSDLVWLLETVGRGLAVRPWRSMFEATWVHTDLHLDNLLWCAEGVRLLDVEQATISSREWDLAHFCAPTTLAWSNGYAYGRSHELLCAVIPAYARAVGCCSRDLLRNVASLVPWVVFRCLIWCMEHSAGSGNDKDVRGMVRPSVASALLNEAEELAWKLG